MDRKQFLLGLGIGVASVSTFGFIKKKDDSFIGDCETTKDILGPYYRPGAPVRNTLLTGDIPGNKITIQGRVFGDDCVTPLKNALVEAWQCDTQGRYDSDSKEYTLRAGWETEGDGAYAFHTILPGKYLNGAKYRPAHIHFRVSAPGYKDLISQVYFEGDTHIKEDPWASDPRAKERILNFVMDDVNGGLTVYFDVYLRKS